MTNSVLTAVQPKFKAFNAEAQLQSVSEFIAEDFESPMLYVGTYRKYNEGSIFGAWIDLDAVENYEEFMEICHKLHSDEDDPELMYQDYSGFPKAFYDECLGRESFDKIKAYAELCDQKEAYEAFVDATGNDDIESFQDRYQGEWESEEQFAEHIVEECYPEIADSTLGCYFDYKAFARDLFFDYTFWDGHVFSNN